MKKCGRGFLGDGGQSKQEAKDLFLLIIHWRKHFRAKRNLDGGDTGRTCCVSLGMTSLSESHSPNLWFEGVWFDNAGCPSGPKC